MKKEHHIYLLRDPRTCEVKWVGETTNLRMRIYNHLSPRKKEEGKPKWLWIRELESLGLKPIVEVVEIVGSNFEEREKYWINKYRQETELFNESIGGRGCLGVKQSKEAIEKTRSKTWGLMPFEERSVRATERNLKAWARRTPEERLKIGKKIAESRKKNLTPEQISEIARRNGKRTYELHPELKEEFAQRSRSWWAAMTPEEKKAFLDRRIKLIMEAKAKKKKK